MQRLLKGGAFPDLSVDDPVLIKGNMVIWQSKSVFDLQDLHELRITMEL